MAYVDGFVIPVKADQKDAYVAAARQIIALYREHGALRCVETWGEGMDPGKQTSFPRAVNAGEGDAVVFSWMEFPDKAASDAAHEAVWSDPRAEAVMASGIVDGQRMIIGGFDVILDIQ